MFRFSAGREVLLHPSVSTQGISLSPGLLAQGDFTTDVMNI